MKVRELFDMLVRQAKIFREDDENYKRNSHMHDISEAPPREVVDAVLTGFINHLAATQCVDYGLYSEDLKRKEDSK